MFRIIACWACLGLAFFHPIFAQSIDFADGIVAYFPFNGNARDMTNQGNDGLVNGATLTTNRYGEARSAYNFDGIKQSIRIPYNRALDFSQREAFAVSLWIQPRDITPGCILLKNFDYGLKWNSIKSPLTFYSGIQGGYPNTARKRWSSDEWYHLVLVQEADRLLLYINGNLDMSLSQSHRTKNGEQDLYLGAHPYFWGAYAGKVDDIVIYDRALNEYEVQALYQIQTMPVEVKPRKAGPQLKASQVAGVWQGVLTQPANSSTPSYAYWVKLEARGSRVTGYTRIEVEESNAYGVASIEGELVGDRVNFREVKITSQKNFQGFEWCQKFGRLSLDPQENALRGEWFADNCQRGGKMILYKTQTPFNFYDNRLSEYVSIDQMVERLKAGEKVESTPQKAVKLEMENVEYETNSSNINASSKAYLRRTLVPFLRDNPSLKLLVTGHTDSVGDDKYNLFLSKRRAKAVVDLLVEQGISASRLSYEGYGESQPIADNNTSEGRSANRRVEFEVSTE